jgi:hypothetical protein
MNRLLVERICLQETVAWSHLLLGGPQRTFAPDFYETLEQRMLSWAARLLNRAAMFARSRAASVGYGAVTLCETDLNHAWELIVQEDQEN